MVDEISTGYYIWQSSEFSKSHGHFPESMEILDWGGGPRVQRDMKYVKNQFKDSPGYFLICQLFCFYFYLYSVQ